MKILITGICGFVGYSLAQQLLLQGENVELCGLDSLIRPGSDSNRKKLTEAGVKLVHADIRNASDLECLPAVDWVIDAAANPSVLAGVDGQTSSRQLIEHNLGGTVNILEYCKRVNAGLILLSTSRVYSIAGLSKLEVGVEQDAYQPLPKQAFPLGLNRSGVGEAYSTQAPVSLYGATKVASEVLALEYSHTYGFPVWVNRCGVLAGAGQFGRPDQGIFAYWIHSWQQKRSLKYIGFDGQGHQVRDCLHPDDLAVMIRLQIAAGMDRSKAQIQNLSGGVTGAMSLRQLSAWCETRFGPNDVGCEPMSRPFDIPWLVLDSSLAKAQWNWRPKRGVDSILEEIAQHAEANPDWLKLSAPY